MLPPASREEPLKRESAAERRDPGRGPSVKRDPSATLELDMSGNSRERSEEFSSLGRNPDGEALHNIINKLSDVRNLKDIHLKHHHMSSAQLKKRTTHLDFLGKVYDLYQHVVKTCPLCNSTKPRPDRSRVIGLRAEEFWRSHLVGSWFDKNWRPNLWISFRFGWCDITLNSISKQEYLSIRSHFKTS